MVDEERAGESGGRMHADTVAEGLGSLEGGERVVLLDRNKEICDKLRSKGELAGHGRSFHGCVHRQDTPWLAQMLYDVGLIGERWTVDGERWTVDGGRWTVRAALYVLAPYTKAV